MERRTWISSFLLLLFMNVIPILYISGPNSWSMCDKLFILITLHNAKKTNSEYRYYVITLCSRYWLYCLIWLEKEEQWKRSSCFGMLVYLSKCDLLWCNILVSFWIMKLLLKYLWSRLEYIHFETKSL